MLKEERAAIRRRLRDAVYELCELPAYKPRACVDRSLKDLRAVLDALDAETLQADTVQSVVILKNHDIDKLWADRDQWKAQAEAYKGALEEGQCCIACYKRPGCGQILPCERFKLDVERFGKEQGHE